MKHAIALLAVVGLIGCGGGSRSAGPSDPVLRAAPSGPIRSACLASDRKARSNELCGCIQAAADITLSSADQSLAASFYDDPQRAQDIRQSDRTRDERFWQRYRDYAEMATAFCG